MTNEDIAVDAESQDEVLEISFDELQKQEEVFIDHKPVKKSISWKRQIGKKFKTYNVDVFIRRQNFDTFNTFIKDMDNPFKTLAASLAKDEEGKKNLLTEEQAKRLHPELAMLFVQAINEVNTKKN